MNRPETTKFLSKLLESKLSGKLYSKEVSLDYGSVNVRRVDYMSFEPEGVVFQSDIEKGIFTCYEIKSCKDDVYSGNGLNFIGEKNYIVMTMGCYKEILNDLHTGKLQDHVRILNSGRTRNFGIMVAIPKGRTVLEEYEKPTECMNGDEWELTIIIPCRSGGRSRSTTELLFCMLRSKSNK